MIPPSQALVKLFLDLNEKHGAGLLTSAVRPEDVIHTIELLLSDLSNCSTLLEIAPVYKRQQESWDKVHVYKGKPANKYKAII